MDLIDRRGAEVLPLPPHMFHVLLVLNAGPSHGYGIKKAVAERTDGAVDLDAGGLYRLIARLEEMLDEGESRFRRHRKLAGMQRDWAAKHGLGLLAQPEYRSPTVTAVLMPDSIPATEFVHAAKTVLNVQIAPGYGPMRKTAIRIAAMGSTSESEMERFLAGLSLMIRNWSAYRPTVPRVSGAPSAKS